MESHKESKRNSLNLHDLNPHYSEHYCDCFIIVQLFNVFFPHFIQLSSYFSKENEFNEFIFS